MRKNPSSHSSSTTLSPSSSQLRRLARTGGKKRLPGIPYEDIVKEENKPLFPVGTIIKKTFQSQPFFGVVVGYRCGTSHSRKVYKNKNYLDVETGLREMGYTESDCERAASHCSSIYTAVDWLNNNNGKENIKDKKVIEKRQNMYDFYFEDGDFVTLREEQVKRCVVQRSGCNRHWEKGKKAISQALTSVSTVKKFYELCQNDENVDNVYSTNNDWKKKIKEFWAALEDKKKSQKSRPLRKEDRNRLWMEGVEKTKKPPNTRVIPENQVIKKGDWIHAFYLSDDPSSTGYVYVQVTGVRKNKKDRLLRLQWDDSNSQCNKNWFFRNRVVPREDIYASVSENFKFLKRKTKKKSKLKKNRNVLQKMELEEDRDYKSKKQDTLATKSKQLDSAMMPLPPQRTSSCSSLHTFSNRCVAIDPEILKPFHFTKLPSSSRPFRSSIFLSPSRSRGGIVQLKLALLDTIRKHDFATAKTKVKALYEYGEVIPFDIACAAIEASVLLEGSDNEYRKSLRLLQTMFAMNVEMFKPELDWKRQQRLKNDKDDCNNSYSPGCNLLHIAVRIVHAISQTDDEETLKCPQHIPCSTIVHAHDTPIKGRKTLKESFTTRPTTAASTITTTPSVGHIDDDKPPPLPPPPSLQETPRKITLQTLMNLGHISPGQDVLSFNHDIVYSATITTDGKIKYKNNGNEFECDTFVEWYESIVMEKSYRIKNPWEVVMYCKKSSMKQLRDKAAFVLSTLRSNLKTKEVPKNKKKERGGPDGEETESEDRKRQRSYPFPLSPTIVRKKQRTLQKKKEEKPLSNSLCTPSSNSLCTPSSNSRVWSKEEHKQFLKAFKNFGRDMITNKWDSIAEEIPSRSLQDIKTYFHLFQKRQMEMVLKKGNTGGHNINSCSTNQSKQYELSDEYIELPPKRIQNAQHKKRMTASTHGQKAPANQQRRKTNKLLTPQKQVTVVATLQESSSSFTNSVSIPVFRDPSHPPSILNKKQFKTMRHKRAVSTAASIIRFAATTNRKHRLLYRQDELGITPLHLSVANCTDDVELLAALVEADRNLYCPKFQSIFSAISSFQRMIREFLKQRRFDRMLWSQWDRTGYDCKLHPFTDFNRINLGKRELEICGKTIKFSIEEAKKKLIRLPSFIVKEEEKKSKEKKWKIKADFSGKRKFNLNLTGKRKRKDSSPSSSLLCTSPTFNDSFSSSSSKLSKKQKSGENIDNDFAFGEGKNLSIDTPCKRDELNDGTFTRKKRGKGGIEKNSFRTRRQVRKREEEKFFIHGRVELKNINDALEQSKELQLAKFKDAEFKLDENHFDVKKQFRKSYAKKKSSLFSNQGTGKIYAIQKTREWRTRMVDMNVATKRIVSKTTKGLVFQYAWIELAKQGWKCVVVPKGADSEQPYFLPAGVERRPPWRNRTDYWDSKSLVLKHLSRTQPQLLRSAEKKAEEETKKRKSKSSEFSTSSENLSLIQDSLVLGTRGGSVRSDCKPLIETKTEKRKLSKKKKEKRSDSERRVKSQAIKPSSSSRMTRKGNSEPPSSSTSSRKDRSEKPTAQLTNKEGYTFGWKSLSIAVATSVVVHVPKRNTTKKNVFAESSLDEEDSDSSSVASDDHEMAKVRKHLLSFTNELRILMKKENISENMLTDRFNIPMKHFSQFMKGKKIESPQNILTGTKLANWFLSKGGLYNAVPQFLISTNTNYETEKQKDDLENSQHSESVEISNGITLDSEKDADAMDVDLPCSELSEKEKSDKKPCKRQMIEWRSSQSSDNVTLEKAYEYKILSRNGNLTKEGNACFQKLFKSNLPPDPSKTIHLDSHGNPKINLLKQLINFRKEEIKLNESSKASSLKDLNSKKSKTYLSNFICCQNLIPDVTKKPFQQNDILFTTVDRNGFSVVHYAAEMNASRCILLLLNCGVLPDFTIQCAKATPLHLAVWKGQEESTRVLLDAGAEPRLIGHLHRVKSKECRTLLEDAAQNAKSLNSNKLINIPSSNSGTAKLILPRFSFDISNGVSRLPIPAINNVDLEPFPQASFTYIDNCSEISNSKQLLANHSFSCCDCADQGLDCYSNPNCACRKRGGLQYDEDGLLTTKSKILYECGKNCKCHKNCLLRTTSNGLQVALRACKLSDKGWGIFALQNIPAGQFICCYEGESVQPKEEGYYEQDVGEMTFVIQVKDFGGKRFKFGVDATKKGNIGRLFNHSCNPNLELRLVLRAQGTKSRNDPKLAFFTSKAIHLGDEMTWTYSRESTGKIQCLCGAKNCKGFL
eukprot:g3680.t1